MLGDSWDSVRQRVTLQIGTGGKDRSEGGRKHHLLSVLCMGNCSKEWEKGIGMGRMRGVLAGIRGGGEAKRKGKAVSCGGGQAV